MELVGSCQEKRYTKIRMSKFVACFIAVVLCLFVTRNTLASGISLGVASMILLNESGAIDGAIVCNNEGNNELCYKDSDPNVAGIITFSPAAIFDTDSSRSGEVPLVTTGKAYVLVSTENGIINIGDYVTTSSKHKGIGVKALKSGYVVGTALTSYENNDVNKYGRIMVSLGVKPALLNTSASNNLFDLMKQGLESAFMTPLSALRYVVAALLIIASVLYSFFNFANIAKKGVEAVGRNPMASKAINLSVLMNILFSLALVGCGLAISYLVMTL